MHYFVKLNTLFLLLLCALPVWAESNEDRGLAIATEAKNRDRGWQDSGSTMLMILRHRNGKETTREMRSLSLEVPGDGDKSLTIFDRPLDVKNTAFLSFSHPLEADEQWLYLPALKRVKRIASRNKSGPFLGSEFAFEDLSSFEIEKYTYRYLRDEECAGEPCFVLEQFPQDQFSGYTRIVAWLDQSEYRVQRVEYYDRKGELLKTLTLHDYEQYLDKYWRPLRQQMVNHQTGKSTEIRINDLKFRTGVDESDFTQNSLKRAR